MDKEQRNLLRRAVEKARKLLEDEVADQLEGIYNILPDGALRDEAPGDPVIRSRLLDVMAHHRASGSTAKQAVERATREMAFTIFNRFVALKMCEKRGLVRECISRGPDSDGVRELCDGAPGLRAAFADGGYRLIVEAIMDELSLGLKVLFDRRSPTSPIWPRPIALAELLSVLNDAELTSMWTEDETIGWIYQYFHPKEEREAMREESVAPRDSYELAVRNQFFTPRYVVEFLTDNTLGRIWHEMTRGETKLTEQCSYLVRRPNEIFLKPRESPQEQPKRENLSQEELLKQPVFVLHRPLKDPRTILMLDPACGSMHFGLYAFDLFEVIYHEAWALEQSLGADALDRSPAMKSLHDTYSARDAFLKDVPRLIIEYNLHGIDIDARCTQIAALSLWLRAQKAWQGLGLKPAERPTIKRSNIVCAEPMPGEKELLREFVERELPSEERRVVLLLLEAIFDKMQLADEVGSLLKIEDEIRSAIADAKRVWEKGPQPEQATLFSEFERITRGEPKIDFSRITDEQFWDGAESRIYDALRDYAEQAENGGGFQRRLFAEDAARGFAFIDVCRKRYDVTVMNPPFGEPTASALPYIEDTYPVAKKNLYIAAIERGGSLLLSHGQLGCISDRTYITHTRYTEFRQEYAVGDQGRMQLAYLVDHGWGVLDSYVQTASAVLSKARRSIATFCVDLKGVGDAAVELRTNISEATEGRALQRTFVHQTSSLGHLPNGVLAFWMHPRVVKAFAEWPSLDPAIAEVRSGLSSSDNERFYKLVWEVPSETVGATRRWSYLSNGGDPFPFFRFQVYVIDFGRDGYMVKALAQELYGSETRTIKNQAYYRRRGLSYGKRTENFSIQILPADQLFSNEGHSVFCATDDELWAVCAYLNSDIVSYTLNCIAGLHKESGYVGNLPFPISSRATHEFVASCARKGFVVVAAAFQCIPECHVFNVASLLRSSGPFNLESVLRGQASLANVLDDINSRINSEFRIEGDTDQRIPLRRWNLCKALYGTSEEAEAVRVRAADVASVLVGLAAGRWDVRLATSENPPPDLPNPFAPLPVCSPGQLQNAEGLPARPDDVPAAYPIRIPWDGILVDDPSHPLDIVSRVREVIEIIWKDCAEAIEHEAREILGAKSMRDYFRRPTGFFADHLKRYSKSHRKAPIYWPLSTASGMYTVWVYYPRLTGDTLYKIVTEHVGPKIGKIEDRIAQLEGGEAKQGGREGTRAAKELGELTELVAELKDMREGLLQVTKLPYEPDLNDGVQISAAPLWQFFRLPLWRSELERTWKAIEKGEYDWARLAYAIWPERVNEKCKVDKSLAIAHGLESLYQEASRQSATARSRRRRSRANGARGAR